MTIVLLKCDGCGETFQRSSRRVKRKSRRHFCSRQCYQQQLSGEGNGRWKGGQAKCTCRHCGTEFEVDRAQVEQGRGKHCSLECKYENTRKYRSNSERHREMGRRYELRKKTARAICGSHTPKEWDDLKHRAKYRCVKCRRKRKLCRDHVIPISKGGSDDITNIQPLCRPCNSVKYDHVETLL